MLDMMRSLLESASGNDEFVACLTRAQDLLSADIVRGKIAASRQLTITEMMRQ